MADTCKSCGKGLRRIKFVESENEVELKCDCAERPSYTPVQTRLAIEVVNALGINPSKVLKASMGFPERGIATMTVQLLVTEEQMRAALAAVAATEAKAQQCPRCRSSSVVLSTRCNEPFGRWHCGCGATGRMFPGSPLEEFPLPVSERTSVPLQASGSHREESPR